MLHRLTIPFASAVAVLAAGCAGPASPVDADAPVVTAEAVAAIQLEMDGDRFERGGEEIPVSELG